MPQRVQILSLLGLCPNLAIVSVLVVLQLVQMYVPTPAVVQVASVVVIRLL
jgi:hypothetical protein